MSEIVNVFHQYKPPFENNEIYISTHVDNNIVIKIGFTISEKDYMKTANGSRNFTFKINEDQIEMGKTFIYEPGEPLSSGCIISFPYQSPPPSFTIDVLEIRKEES